jgi:hypothetical protein
MSLRAVTIAAACVLSVPTSAFAQRAIEERAPAEPARVQVVDRAAYRPARMILGTITGAGAGAAAAIPGTIFMVVSLWSRDLGTGAGMFAGGLALTVFPAQFATTATVYGIGHALHGRGNFWATYAGNWAGSLVGGAVIAGGVHVATTSGGDATAGWTMVALASFLPALGASAGYELSSSAATASEAPNTTATRRAPPALALAMPVGFVSNQGAGLQWGGTF